MQRTGDLGSTRLTGHKPRCNCRGRLHGPTFLVMETGCFRYPSPDESGAAPEPEVTPPGPVLRCSCAAMSVTYRKRLAELISLPSRDAIEILIPADRGAFCASCESDKKEVRRAFIRAPHIAVMPANQPYSLSCVRQSDLIIISLACAFFNTVAREAPNSQATCPSQPYSAMDPFLREVGNSLSAEMRMPASPSPVYLDSLAGVIAIHLARNYSGRSAAATSGSSAGLPAHKLGTIKAFIEQHFSEVIRVEQLAATVHMSPYHFSRMFKKATGQSPHAYLTTQRMERAKALLAASNIPLVEVAAQVGFERQGNFTEVFHKHVNVTPRIFRMSCRESEQVNHRPDPAPAGPGGSRQGASSSTSPADRGNAGAYLPEAAQDDAPPLRWPEETCRDNSPRGLS
jgi:AraC family transcriptional regulator